jgi:hypothetical protein
MQVDVRLPVLPRDPVLSIVVPLRDEERALPELYERLNAVLERIGQPAEIVFVNDGSRDAVSYRPQLDAAAISDQSSKSLQVECRELRA